MDTDDRESVYPIDEGLRTRGLLEAKGPRQEAQDARDGAQSDACHQKELECQKDQLPLRPGDKSLGVVLELPQMRLGLFECRGGSVSRSADARKLFALVSIAIAPQCGFMFPLIPTVFDFGKLTHHTHACSPHGHGPWGRPGLRDSCPERIERSAS